MHTQISFLHAQKIFRRVLHHASALHRLQSIVKGTATSKVAYIALTFLAS